MLMRHHYGVLTDISKDINTLLGDESGRTVSRRTADGFQRTLAPNLSDQASEDVVHLGMLALPFLLKSEKPAAGIARVVVGALLFGSYHAGK